MTTLKLVTDLPRGLPEFGWIADWAADVGTASGGALEISVFAAGELVPAFDTADAVQAGLADLGWFSAAAEAASYPEANAFAMPLSAELGADASGAAWQVLEDGAFAIPDLRFLAAHMEGGDALLLNGADGTVDDLVGLKIRVPVGQGARFLEDLGASPVALPLSELFPALQRGVIDGVLADASLGEMLDLDSLVDRAVVFGDGTLFAPELRTLAIGEAAFDGLSDDLKALLLKDTGLTLSREFGAAADAARDAALAASEAEVATLTGATRAEWEAAAAAFTDEALAAIGGDAAAIHDAFLAALGGGGGSGDGPDGPTAGDDRLTGTRGGEALAGQGGDDRIKGRGGADTLDGGRGDDTLLGGKGGDRLLGKAGQDDLAGGAGRDLLRGGGGTDTLAGGGGNDRLFGNGGGDALSGGGGRDRLEGGGGSDTLTGGGGADRFVFAPRSGSDVIADFDPVRDRIDFDGAASLNDLTFAETGVGTEVSFRGTTVLVEDVPRSVLEVDELFGF